MVVVVVVMVVFAGDCKGVEAADSGVSMVEGMDAVQCRNIPWVRK